MEFNILLLAVLTLTFNYSSGLRKHGMYQVLPNTRTADVWITGTNNKTSWEDPFWQSYPGNIHYGFQEMCPPNSWVNEVFNFKPEVKSGECLLFHLDFICRTKEELGGPIEGSEGHIVSRTARDIRNLDHEHSSSSGGDETRLECYNEEFLRRSQYENCNNVGGAITNTYITGIALKRQAHPDRVDRHPTKNDPVGWINFMCGDLTSFKNHGDPPQTDSIEVIKCPEKMAMCGIQTRTYIIAFARTGSISIMEDARIGCCGIDPALITTKPPTPVTPPPAVVLPPVTPPPAVVLPPVTPPPNPTGGVTPPPTTTGTGSGEGEDGIYNLQKNFYLFWAGVLLNTITRYNYFYTPNTIQNEKEWETAKCADGTFVNGFEVTNPVSTYYWTRRIMVIKFKCGATDGSKSSELDLYGKLRSGIFTLQQADLTLKSECVGGHYSSMEIIYYLDKAREKLAVVNAWGINMKCSKAGNTEPHKHDINSTPKNSIPDNVIKNGVVDCGTGKAICGFTTKITENRRGNFEGLYFKVICCSV